MILKLMNALRSNLNWVLRWEFLKKMEKKSCFGSLRCSHIESSDRLQNISILLFFWLTCNFRRQGFLKASYALSFRRKKGDTDVGIHINNSRLYRSFTSVFAQQRWRARSFFITSSPDFTGKPRVHCPCNLFKGGGGYSMVRWILLHWFSILSVYSFAIFKCIKHLKGEKSYLVYLCSEGPFWHFCHIFDLFYLFFFAAHIKLWMHLKMCSFPDSFNPVR